MADTIYKLPLDPVADKDLIDWINSHPRNKKSEVVRHALRYYKSQLKEGEVFIMPSPETHASDTPAVVKERKPTQVKEQPEKKKRPKINLKELKNPE